MRRLDGEVPDKEVDDDDDVKKGGEKKGSLNSGGKKEIAARKQTSNGAGRPSKLSEEQLQAIKQHFETFIQLTAVSTKKETLAIISKHPILNVIDYQVIKQRVNYEIQLRKGKMELPKDVQTPDERTKQWIEESKMDERSVCSSNSARTKWNDEENYAISEYFADFLASASQLPSRGEIRNMFMSTSAPLKIQEIWTQQDSPKWKTRCVEKVRWEWRSRAKRLHKKK